MAWAREILNFVTLGKSGTFFIPAGWCWAYVSHVRDTEWTRVIVQPVVSGKLTGHVPRAVKNEVRMSLEAVLKFNRTQKPWSTFADALFEWIAATLSNDGNQQHDSGTSTTAKASGTVQQAAIMDAVQDGGSGNGDSCDTPRGKSAGKSGPPPVVNLDSQDKDDDDDDTD